MNMRNSLLMRALPALVLLTPFAAGAQVVAVGHLVGIFNIFVGLMLTAALLIYAFGFIMWWIRLGTWPSYRTVAVRVLEWAVAILFTLVVLLGIVQFFQFHQRAATYVISVIVLIAIIAIIVYLIAHSGGDEKKEEH